MSWLKPCSMDISIKQEQRLQHISFGKYRWHQVVNKQKTGLIGFGSFFFGGFFIFFF